MSHVVLATPAVIKCQVAIMSTTGCGTRNTLDRLGLSFNQSTISTLSLIPQILVLTLDPEALFPARSPCRTTASSKLMKLTETNPSRGSWRPRDG